MTDSGGSSRTTRKVSVTLALEALKFAVEDVAKADAAHRRSIIVRDQMIRDARQGGVASRVLQGICGLSRQRIARITDARESEWDARES